MRERKGLSPFLALTAVTTVFAASAVRAQFSSPIRSVDCTLPAEGWGDPQYIGMQIAPYQDLDRDGTDDFVAMLFSGMSFRSYVIVYSGATGEPLRMLTAPQGDLMLLATARLADLDHDGFDEVLIIHNMSPSSSLIVYSPASDTSQTLTAEQSTVAGNQPSGFPEFAGDLNHDGVKDIIVPYYSGALDGNPERSGFVVIYSGKDLENLGTIAPPDPAANGIFGYRVSSFIDYDDDGTSDLLILQNVSSSDRAATDTIYVISGATFEPLVAFPSPAIAAALGVTGMYASPLRYVPDMNSDAVADIYLEYTAVKSDSSSHVTLCYLLSGADGTVLKALQFTDKNLVTTLAGFLSASPDSRPDLLFCSNPDTYSVDVYPQVFCILLGVEGEPRLWVSTDYSIHSKVSAAAVRDQNGDGREDALVGDFRSSSYYSSFEVHCESLASKLVCNSTGLDFGVRDPSHGPSQTLSVTLRNDGAALFFTGPGVEIVGPDRTEFALVNPDLSPIPAYIIYWWGAGIHSRDFGIYFDPSTMGEKSAEVVFTTSDPTSPTIRVALHGTAAPVFPVQRGVFVAGGYEGLFEIDPGTGNRRVVASTQVGTGPYFEGALGLLLLDSGRLLVSKALTGAYSPDGGTEYNYLMVVDLMTAARTYHPAEPEFVPVDPVANSAAFQGMARDPLTDGFLVANRQTVSCPGYLSSRILRFDPVSAATDTVVSSAFEGVGQGPGFCDPWDLDVARDGTLIVTDRDLGLFRVDPASGDRDLFLPFTVASDSASTCPLSTAIDPNARIYTVVKNLAAVYRVDPDHGTLEVASGAGVGEGPDLVSPSAVAFDPLNGMLMAYDSGLRALFQVDVRTGDREILSCAADPYRRGNGPDLPAVGHSLVVSPRLALPGQALYVR